MKPMLSTEPGVLGRHSGSNKIDLSHHIHSVLRHFHFFHANLAVTLYIRMTNS